MTTACPNGKDHQGGVCLCTPPTKTVKVDGNDVKVKVDRRKDGK